MTKIIFAMLVLVCYTAQSQTVKYIDVDDGYDIKLKCVTYHDSVDCDWDSYTEEKKAIIELRYLVIRLKERAYAIKQLNDLLDEMLKDNAREGLKND